MQKFRYTRHDQKETAIDFIVRRFPYRDRKSWLACIRSGEIKINNKWASSQTILKSKDVISYERPREQEPEIDDTYEILHQDESIVIVEKNGNIPISESGRYHQNTLINILKEREGYPELYAVHRLDKETSGIVLIAKKKEIATRLGKQFSRKVPEKIYYAVLLGEFVQKQILVDQALKKSSPEHSKVRIRQIVDSSGKHAKTVFTAELIANGLTLARIRTFSGRTHQIRCHAEYIGHPILGDKLYGQTDDFFINLLQGGGAPIFPPYGEIRRQLLHASSLSFVHPRTQDRVSFQSDYLREFQANSFLKEWLLKRSRFEALG